jgi:hypothetical protein
VKETTTNKRENYLATLRGEQPEWVPHYGTDVVSFIFPDNSNYDWDAEISKAAALYSGKAAL